MASWGQLGAALERRRIESTTVPAAQSQTYAYVAVRSGHYEAGHLAADKTRLGVFVLR